MEATMWMKEVEQLVTERLPTWIKENPLLRLRLQEAIGAETVVSTRRMTYEEFLEWADEDTLAEWVDGEVVMTSPASRQHQSIADFLLKVMGTYVESHDLGVVISAPFQMKLEQSGHEADLLFVTTEHRERLKETHLDGPADLVVEIVSSESAERDRGAKFYEYARGGVPEYWLLDPQARWAEFYRLEAGRYRPAFSGEAGEYHSPALPGFWLRTEWLWQDPLPVVEDVLLEVGGDAYAQRWIARLRERGLLP